MSHRSFVFLTTLFFYLLCIPAIFAGTTGVGGPYWESHLAYQGPETLTLLVIPDGSGPPLDQAFLPLWGETVDATITLSMWDEGGNPITSYPAEDIWLESEDGGLVLCVSGTNADTDTDQYGRTQWLNPLRAGGSSQALTLVRVGGVAENSTGMNLSFNSPDINGDLSVNGQDLQAFVEDFFSDYEFRSDFFRDGQVGAPDLVLFAQAYGASCP